MNLKYFVMIVIVIFVLFTVFTMENDKIPKK
jgi:hypothetical protein